MTALNNVPTAARTLAAVGFLFACSCAEESPPPGADAPIVGADGSEASTTDAKSPTLSAADCEPVIHSAGSTLITLNRDAFEGCDSRSLESITTRIIRTLDTLAIDNPRVPTRPDIFVPTGALPSKLDDIEVRGVAPTPLVLLPSPGRVREAIGPAPDAITLADRTPDAAVTLLFPPLERGQQATIWLPTPIGHPAPLPTVTRRSRPWLTMGRGVVARPTELESVEAEIEDFQRRAGIKPDAALWSAPLNSVASAITYADDTDTRSWIAYSVADGVAGRRSRSGWTTDAGESSLTVPFQSPEHDPKGVRDSQLLRIPAANERTPGTRIPGERITLDEWFAAPDRGYALLVHDDHSRPGLPSYLITTDFDWLRSEARNGRIESVLLFETITGEQLNIVLEAFLGS